MAKTFHLEIVTPDGPAFKGEVDALVVPAWEGQLGVLPGHEPEVAVMKPGALRYSRDGKDEWLAISGGFVHIEPATVVVLAETAEQAEAIDTARAKAAAGAKQQAMSQGGMSEEQVSKMQASLLKELVRLRVAERFKKG